MPPSRLQHLGHAVETRPEIIESVGPIGIGDREPFSDVQSFIEVGIKKDPPVAQGIFSVVDYVAVEVIPDPAQDLRVVVLNDDIQIRNLDAGVAAVLAAE